MSQLKSVPYQIDYHTKLTGRYVDFTKKSYRWEFGFANVKAIEAGEMGALCRGDEHEVLLTWSLVSGKMMLRFNGKEIHYDGADGNLIHKLEIMHNGVLQEIEVEAHLGYMNDILELRINGQPYKTLLKIYELSKESVTELIGKYPNSKSILMKSSEYYERFAQDEDQQEIMNLFVSDLDSRY